MAFNGSGVFVRLYSWITDRNGGIKILASRMDSELDGMATGLSNCITKDGQTTITNNISLNSKRITNLGTATAGTDAINRDTGDGRFVRLAGGAAGGAMTGAINYAKGADIASAATTDIGAATGNVVTVTGTTTITALGTVQAGTTRIVRFAGALTLTHNAASLVLPTGADIATAAGDIAVFVSEGSGNWRCAAYTRASGLPLAEPTGSIVSSAFAEYTANANLTVAIPNDDTIPQVTEGTQIISAVMTPATATNKVRGEVKITGTTDAGGPALTAAVFVNGGANAISASYAIIPQANYEVSFSFAFEHSPASTSAQTYTVRVGPSSGTARLNGPTTARRYGGVMSSSLVLEEIKA